jgi:hypothetical protein
MDILHNAAVLSCLYTCVSRHFSRGGRGVGLGVGGGGGQAPGGGVGGGKRLLMENAQAGQDPLGLLKIYFKENSKSAGTSTR